MAKKTISITEQIAALEADLAKKNAILQEYEKLFDRLLKYHFGLSKKDLEKLIADSNAAKKSITTDRPVHSGASGDLPATVIPLEGETPSAY